MMNDRLPRRIAAAQTEGDGAHAVHPEVAQALDRQPLVRRPEHGQAQRGEVLGDFGPADAAMDLHEVAAPGDLGAQRASPFQLAVDLAVERLDGNERVSAGPQRAERFVEKDFAGVHQRALVITSAARSALL
jgi:hypothetical protein